MKREFRYCCCFLVLIFFISKWNSWELFFLTDPHMHYVWMNNVVYCRRFGPYSHFVTLCCKSMRQYFILPLVNWMANTFIHSLIRLAGIWPKKPNKGKHSTCHHTNSPTSEKIYYWRIFIKFFFAIFIYMLRRYIAWCITSSFKIVFCLFVFWISRKDFNWSPWNYEIMFRIAVLKNDFFDS